MGTGKLPQVLVENMEAGLRGRLAVISASGVTVEEMYAQLKDWEHLYTPPPWLLAVARHDAQAGQTNMPYYALGYIWLANEALFRLGNVATLAEVWGATGPGKESRTAVAITRRECSKMIDGALGHGPEY